VLMASLLLALANAEYERGANRGFGGNDLDKAEQLVAERIWLTGCILRSRSNLAAADALLEQSLAATRATRSRYWEGYILFELGSVARALDHLGDAEVRYREALNVFRTFGASSGTTASLAGLARIATDRADFYRKGRLWGAVEAAEAWFVDEWALNRPGWENDVVARDQPEFARGRDEGRALSLDEATTHALQSNE
jgi:hypothetical protein